ncbi:hypothetical protein CJ231_00700 [Hoylesella buccalis]|uniref:Uncharacterized protein n=1 Tax=Hoylesella buccalis TaxID=28127 RepID=A0A2N6QTH4_9BACT|nr:hypothetical protein [Hoylesella buccalis]PMC25356.1 hypothetical protein CJ231_00700 [Hoylesella buccalis]
MHTFYIYCVEKALKSGNTNREVQIAPMARKVQRLLNIQPRECSGEQFLTTILHDYQYFTTELI